MLKTISRIGETRALSIRHHLPFLFSFSHKATLNVPEAVVNNVLS